MSAYPKDTDLGWRRRVRSRVLRWYDQNGRRLPWRESADPYRIWISEIMLQQTTVVAVVPYYERFFKAFPSVVHLAKADEQQILKLWEGLGYYSRARNIHKAAKEIVESFDGKFPTTVDELLSLPGIGRYTPGAIASLAFDKAAPIVEANTLRLYCRLLGFDDDPRLSFGQQTLWSFAESILSQKESGVVNQALMELGATVCTPKQPQCSKCPVKKHCQAFLSNRQDEIPIPKKRPEITPLVEAALVVENKGKLLLRRCMPGERWAGLWDVPRFDVTPLAAQSDERKSFNKKTVAAIQNDVAQQLQEAVDISVDVGNLLTEIRHTVTRYRIRLVCFNAELRDSVPRMSDGWKWVSRKKCGDYPLSATGRQIVDLL